MQNVYQLPAGAGNDANKCAEIEPIYLWALIPRGAVEKRNHALRAYCDRPILSASIGIDPGSCNQSCLDPHWKDCCCVFSLEVEDETRKTQDKSLCCYSFCADGTDTLGASVSLNAYV